MNSTWRTPAVLLLAVLAAGCATAQPERAFDAVHERVAERAGQETEWSGVSASPEEIRDRVESLLAGEVTADEAAAIALVNNRRLQATYAELGVAAAGLAQASRIRNPMLEVVALFESGNVDLLELSLVSEALSAVLLPLRKQLAQDDYAIIEVEVTRAVLETVTRTRKEFYGLQAELQTLELLRSVLLANEASSDMAGRLYDAGNISRLDRLRERDLLEQTKIQVAEAEMRVLQAREALNRLMGLWGAVTMTWQPAPRLAHPVEAEPLGGDVESRAVMASLALDTAYRDVERAARRLGISRITTVLPDVELGIAAERERGADGDREWSAGPLVAVPVPIFDQGQAASARGQAEIRGLWDRYTAMAVEVRSAAREAAMALAFSRQRADYYREVVIPLRQQVTTESQLHYNAMFIGVFQLLEAKRREIDAGLGYIAALHDYWSARADLDALEMGAMLGDSSGMGLSSRSGFSMTTGGSARGDH